MIDLLDVFLAISMCDRRAPRTWQRHATDSLGTRQRLDIVIPVRNPERWDSPEVIEAACELAGLLNGAEWMFRFIPRQRGPRRLELQSGLDLGPKNGAIVQLQSGGLDSLLGMAQVLAANDSAILIPVSVITNSKPNRVIRDVNKSLRQHFPLALIESSRLHLMQFREGHRIDDREREHRTRILPCLAAGIAVATEYADGRLLLTENGPGAINLPTSLEQLDFWTTRATHPSTLVAVAQLASLVLEHDIRIDNTGWRETKGELAAGVLHDKRFHDAARLTVSCERFPYVNADSPCGICTSCLYRKMALHRAGLGYIDGERKTRANARDQAGGVSLGQAALAVFVEQLNRLLSAEHPYDMLSAQYRRIDEVLEVAIHLGMTEDAVKNSIVDLYRAFVAEAEAFFSADLTMFPPQRDRAVAS